MNKIIDVAAAFWALLNYPFIVLGKSSITLWVILLNVLIIIAFIYASSKIKSWMLSVLPVRKGLNISNWRAAITISYYVFLCLGFMMILQSSGLDLSLFAVLTGAIGIGVGFGMQAIFSNFISGIIILLEKPIKLGDRIEVGDVSGNVSSISVRATTIITNDDVAIIVPNSDFISKQVTNWSHSSSNIRLRISVNVSYSSEPDIVKALLLRVADEEEGVLKNPPPFVRLSEFGENGLLFCLLVWTQDYTSRTGVLKSLLNFKVLKLFRENGIQIPFPQREVHIYNHTAGKI